MTDTTSGSAPSGAEPEAGWAPGHRVRLAFDLVLLAIGAGYLTITAGMEAWNESGPREGFFPLFAGGLFVLCMSIETAMTLVRLIRSPRPGEGTFEWRIAAVLATVGGYLLLVETLGHVITSFLVVGVLLRLFARKPWWHTVLSAALAALVTDFVFSELLGFGLPSGLVGIGFSAWI